MMAPLHGGGGGSATAGNARRRSSRSNNGGISASPLPWPPYTMMKWAVVTGMAVVSTMTMVVLFYHHGMVEPTAHHLAMWGTNHPHGKNQFAGVHASGRSLGAGVSRTGAAPGNLNVVTSSSTSTTAIFHQRLRGSYTGQPAGTAATTTGVGASWRRSAAKTSVERESRHSDNTSTKKPLPRPPSRDGDDAGDAGDTRGSKESKIEVGKKAPAEGPLAAANEAVIAQQSLMAIVAASRELEERERLGEELLAHQNHLGKILGGREKEEAEIFDAVADHAAAAAAAAEGISIQEARGGRRPQPLARG